MKKELQYIDLPIELESFLTISRIGKQYQYLFTCTWLQSELTIEEVRVNLHRHEILDASTGFASGFVWLDDTIIFGRKHLADAIEIDKNNRFDINFFTPNDVGGWSIDFNKVSFFLYRFFMCEFVHFLLNEYDMINQSKAENTLS